MRHARVRTTQRRGLALLLAILVLAPATALVGRPAGAQALGDLIANVRSGEGPGRVLEPDTEQRALETAARAFGRSATRRVEHIRDAHPGLPGTRVERMREIAAEQTRRFASEAREDLIAAKGDGLLTQEELASHLADVRARRLDALEAALDAARAGAPAPPRREAAEGPLEFLRAMASYTLRVRNPPHRWMLFAGCVLGALLLAWGGVFGLRRLLRRDGPLTRRTLRFTELARGPFYVAAAAGGAYAGVQLLWMPIAVTDRLGPVMMLLLAVALLWLGWNASGPLGRSLANLFGGPDTARPEAVDVARKALRLVALVGFALLVIRGVFDARLTTVLAGLGVAGVAASVAAQDTLRNVFGSFTLHGDRPFVVGELVRFQGRLGTVQEIGFRSTRIRTLDGPVLVVPNSELVRESVVNLSRRPWVRHVDSIDLVYDTPPKRMEEALRIVREILERRAHPTGQPPHVAFDGFAPYSLRLRLWWCSDGADYWESRRQRTHVNLEILERFRDAGLEFAFPTRTLHVDSLAAPEEAEEAGATASRARGGER